MSSLQSDQYLSDNLPKANISNPRRAILVEIARLYGERNVVQDRLTWLNRQLEIKRSELQQLDNQ